jgi:4-hydroxybenzoate polyprenyltransferase
VKDTELEWFRPLWLRLLVTGLVAIWFGWELFFTQDQLWMIITGAALAYAVWNLFIKYDDKAGKKPAAGDGTDGKPKV